ncbi:MAG: L7Ae/L30e/S12e/Gadd45 family ribosomal protein [Gemmatimonadota bacterium]
MSASGRDRKPADPDALLRMLGLAARAGAVLPGTERVRDAARSSSLYFALVAKDASDNSRDKLLPLLNARQIPYAVVFDRNALGAAIGKSPLSALGITDRKLAGRVQEMAREFENTGK